MPTAITHDPIVTFPASSTNTALVRWSGTGGNTLLDTSGILSDGSNITLNARGEVRFSDADSSHYIAFESPATVGTSYTMTLPADLPAANEVLTVTSYSSGAGVLEWAAPSSGPSQASATETESQTNVDKYVPPDLLHRHHGVAKATWNGNANVATMAEHASYGMDSFTDNGVGDYTFTFDTAFSRVNYSWAASAGHIAGELVGGITVNQYDADASARTTTTLRIYVAYGHYSPSVSNHLFNAVDCNELDLIVFGDQ